MGAAALRLYIAQEQPLARDHGHQRHKQVHMHVAVVINLRAGSSGFQTILGFQGTHVIHSAHPCLSEGPTLMEEPQTFA